MIQKLLDNEVRRIAASLPRHDEVTIIMAVNRARLDALADALLEQETLDEDDAYAAAGVCAIPGEARRRTRRGGAKAP